MVEHAFEPGHAAGEKLRVQVAEAPATDPSALKQRLAERVRADSRERGVPTPEHVVQELAAPLPQEQLGALLAEMAAEEAYADLKAIVAPSRRVYLFSELHLAPDRAKLGCLGEEAKIAIVDRIRSDSQRVALTPLTALDDLFPWPEPAQRTALLDELQRDGRYRDIQQVSGPDGVVYFHSDAYVSGNYARIMMRARASNAAFSIAELVRDRSRTMPAPTKINVFEDRVFALSRADVREFVELLAAPPPEYADIKRLVHPSTRAVYLYSEKWMDELTAWRLMDWEEVGLAQNP